MGENVSRDPSDYRLSTHAYQQAKDRSISREFVSKAIREGEITPAAKEHQWEFQLELDWLRREIGIVVDPRDGTIVTVQWVNVDRKD